MTNREYDSFAAFWEHYVREHRHPACRAWHYVGTAAGTAVGVAGLLTLSPLLLALALVIGYGCAWVGHFYVEENHPATFRYPLWSFLADFKMIGLALGGRMRSEVERCHQSSG